jgi:DNA-binding beta-propeller fold protein YncE
MMTLIAGAGETGSSDGEGPATEIKLSNPFGIALDTLGKLYVADELNNRVLMISKGPTTTIAKIHGAHVRTRFASLRDQSCIDAHARGPGPEPLVG